MKWIEVQVRRIFADRAATKKNDSHIYTSRNEASDQSRGTLESSSSTTMNRRRGLLAQARVACTPIKRPCPSAVQLAFNTNYISL